LAAATAPKSQKERTVTVKANACIMMGGLLLPVTLALGDSSNYVGSEQWQTRRLLNPTPAELAEEAEGRIIIYDGLKDKDVNRALDAQFDRVEHMMFIRTKKTSPQGDIVDYDDDC
jgi:hypothetical protein